MLLNFEMYQCAKNEKAKNIMKIHRAKKAHEQEGNRHVMRKTDERDENEKRRRKIRANQSETKSEKNQMRLKSGWKSSEPNKLLRKKRKKERKQGL